MDDDNTQMLFGGGDENTEGHTEYLFDQQPAEDRTEFLSGQQPEEDRTLYLNQQQSQDDRTLYLTEQEKTGDGTQYLFQSQQQNVKKDIQRDVYHLKEGTFLQGRYEVKSVVGFGGFGVMYSAIDHTLNIQVAVKEFYPTSLVNRMPDGKTVSVFSAKREEDFRKGLVRFLDEARNMARFSDVSNIVSVYNFFEENGTAYIVMEFLEGVSLKEYTKANGGKIPWEKGVEYILEVIQALKVLHKQKIIHRDISPDNIFICNNGIVKLLDFGAARFSSNPEEEKTLSVVLKPGFAPPEQYRTKSRQGPYTDIYALGATLYRIITGVIPEQSVNRTTKDDVREPRAVERSIPEYLSKIIMKCMALQPQIRFQSVAELETSLMRRRKVRSVKGEILRRRIIRGVLITGILAVVGVAGTKEYQMIRRSQNKATLVPCSISVWYPVSEGDTKSDTQTRVESGMDDFFQTYPSVTVNIEYVSEKEYATKIAKAAAAGNLPDAFESSLLDKYDNVNFSDLTDVYKMLDMDNYQFGDFQKLYNSCQIPTGYDVTVLYENMTVSTKSGSNSKTDFLNGKSSCYVGTIADYPDVQEHLAGIYSISALDNAKMGYSNVWAVTAGDDEDRSNAAKRFVYYMMSQQAQDSAYLEGGNGLPLLKDTFNSYVDLNPDLSFLSGMSVKPDATSAYGILKSDLDTIYKTIK